MGHYFNPYVVMDNFHWLIDVCNFKSYAGSGNTLIDLNTNLANNITNLNTPTYSAVGSTSYFQYNGTTQYGANGAVSSGISIQGPITINLIFNPSSSAATYNVFALFAGASNSLQIGYRLDLTSGAIWKNGGTALLTYPTVGVGTICHLAYTCDGANNSRVYINGALWSTGTVATNSGTATNYTVASFNSGAGEFFSGRVYYASIHGKVHSANEIARTYHALKKRWGYAGVGTFVNSSNPTGDPALGGLLGGQ